MVDGGVELTFMAAVHSVASEGDRLATFYVMNTSRNRNGWEVTEAALDEALPSLLGKPLGCIPGYRVNHVHKPLDVGRWVSVDGRGRYALATAEITDPAAWEKLNSGEWGPVSVVISAYRIRCSVCGGDVTDEPDEHVKSGEGHEIVESFKFNRVDFVGTPAYPQAGIITLDELKGAQAARARMASYTPEAQRSQSIGRAAGSLGIDPNPEEKKKMSEDITKLKQELKTLTTNYTELKEEHDKLKAGLEKPADEPKEVEEDPKYKELEAKVKVMEDERHAERVAAALDARTKAGLVKDQKAETERLGKLDDETLTILALDAGIVAEKLEKAKPVGPKLKYSKDDRSEFAAAVDTMRDQLGFEPRVKEAKE